jgi:prevent-host-death family protein
MAGSISAAEANRNFSQLLRRVREGHTIVVTSHGRPVAKLVPIDARDHVVRGARAALFERLRATPVTNAGRWTRDELYERDR